MARYMTNVSFSLVRPEMLEIAYTCTIQKPNQTLTHKLTDKGAYLHDGGEEGLRVEESSQPDAGGQREVLRPDIELPDTQQQVCVPGGQCVVRSIR